VGKKPVPSPVVSSFPPIPSSSDGAAYSPSPMVSDHLFFSFFFFFSRQEVSRERIGNDPFLVILFPVSPFFAVLDST